MTRDKSHPSGALESTMQAMSDSSYRGWTRPGPRPPGGVEPEMGETLDFISGHFRIFQYERGHRFSTDDVLVAWYGTQWAPRVGRAADLGSGIGSVALIAAWRLPGARFVTVEAQRESIRLARKSVRYNGLEDRFRLIEGDLRDRSLFAGEEAFDLVFGSPPYWETGTASEPSSVQAVHARIELRGSIDDYASAAERLLASGGLFAFVMPASDTRRSLDALDRAALIRVRSRDVIFREGETPRVTLFAATHREDLPPSFRPFTEQPLIIRQRDGSLHPEYAVIRLGFGYPPDVPKAEC